MLARPRTNGRRGFGVRRCPADHARQSTQDRFGELCDRFLRAQRSEQGIFIGGLDSTQRSLVRLHRQPMIVDRTGPLDLFVRSHRCQPGTELLFGDRHGFVE